MAAFGTKNVHSVHCDAEATQQEGEDFLSIKERLLLPPCLDEKRAYPQ